MSAAPAFPGLLEEMTTQDIQAFDPEVVVLPLGSTEPHGPHLPMGTDCYQVTRLCHLAVRAANENSARVLLYPTLPITNNANFRRFRFALRVGIRTLMQMLIDIVTQCRDDGIRKVVFVNGHGGNPATLDATLREIAGMDDMPFVCWTWGAWPEGVASPSEHASDHGGEDETSRMLWIRPDLVRSDKLANNPFGQLRIARQRLIVMLHGRGDLAIFEINVSQVVVGPLQARIEAQGFPVGFLRLDHFAPVLQNIAH